jgi:hypothetical protein
MQGLDDVPLVTSDEFVTDLVCVLALHQVLSLTLADTLTDCRFEAAFNDLVEAKNDLGIEIDFSLAVNPYHGDSSTLRETLYGLRERGVVSINNPSFKTVEINVGEGRATHFLNRSTLPKEFVERIVRAHFVNEGVEVERKARVSSTA